MYSIYLNTNELFIMNESVLLWISFDVEHLDVESDTQLFKGTIRPVLVTHVSLVAARFSK